MGGEGEGSGVPAKAGHAISKFSGILLDYIAPIGAFFAGLGMGDALGIHDYINAILPKALATNSFVDVSLVAAAGIYVFAGFMLARIVPYVGRALLGLFGGMALRCAFTAMKGPLAALKP